MSILFKDFHHGLLEDPDDLRDEDVGDFCEAVERGDEQVRFDKRYDEAHDEQGILRLGDLRPSWRISAAKKVCIVLVWRSARLPWEKRNGPLGKTVYPARDNPL